MRVFDLAAEIDNPHSRTYTVALLKHLHARYPHASGNAYNVAEDDPNLDVYFALGYRTAFRQIEMELKLS